MMDEKLLNYLQEKTKEAEELKKDVEYVEDKIRILSEEGPGNKLIDFTGRTARDFTYNLAGRHSGFSKEVNNDLVESIRLVMLKVFEEKLLELEEKFNNFSIDLKLK